MSFSLLIIIMCAFVKNLCDGPFRFARYRIPKIQKSHEMSLTIFKRFLVCYMNKIAERWAH